MDEVFLAFQGALAGRYSLDCEIGRGGMGIVYLAREVHLDRLVAIKLLPPERAADAAMRERFLREARLAARLSHPNIIPIHSVADEGGFVFYVMSYIEGETLTQRVRARGPLSASDGVRVFREVAWALAHAHAQGLVHRDVKPDNILLEHATGRALVADFGIAAAIGDAVDVAHGVAGTPEFISPELIINGSADARSDLYSLGATAHFAFSGRFPFEGATPAEVLARHVTEPPPTLAALGLSVPRKVAHVVRRCLAKSPDDRPPSAEALAEQLGVALEQRRDVPAALREFVKRGGRIHGPGSVFYPFAMLGVGAIGGVQYGAAAFVSTLVLGSTAVPFGVLVKAARKLIRVGFTHADLEPAFTAEIEQTIEERAAADGRVRPRLERIWEFVAKVSGAAAITSFAAFLAFAGSVSAPGWLLTLFGFSMPVSVISALGYASLRGRHRDVDTDFWARLWLGRIGRAAFAVAKRLPGGRAVTAAMTHRATELSLGLATESLYESLPKKVRQQLGTLPAVLKRLQHDAQELRKRLDAVQEALAETPESAAAYATAESARDATRANLSEVVGALETIRLGLLRLHAGAATVEGVTTHIELALDVSNEVERLLAARDDVETLLQYPAEAEPTPV